MFLKIVPDYFAHIFWANFPQFPPQIESSIFNNLRKAILNCSPVLDPLYALQLRVDHERPLDRVGQDGGVLRGHVVRGQPLVVPLRDERVVREQREHVGADVSQGERDRLRQLLQVRQPLALEQLEPD